MGFSFNPLMWFVCGSCKEAFPNTEDLKEHKLKQHLGDCLQMKCIVFEEKFVDDAWIPSNRISARDSKSERLLRHGHKNNTVQKTNKVQTFQNPYVALKRLSQTANYIPARERKAKTANRSPHRPVESFSSKSKRNKACESDNEKADQNEAIKIPKPIPIPIFLPKEEPEEEEQTNLTSEGATADLFSSSLSFHSSSNHSDCISKELGDGELIIASVTSSSHGTEVEFAPYPFPFQAGQSSATEDCLQTEVEKVDEEEDVELDRDWGFECESVTEAEADSFFEVEDSNPLAISSSPSANSEPEPGAETKSVPEPEGKSHSEHEPESVFRSDSEVHSNSNSEQGSYKCTECFEKFTSKNKLRVHISKHRRERLKTVKVKSMKKSVSSSSLFACDSCPQVFKFPWQLTRHKMNHPLYVPYKCTRHHCLSAFRTKAGLRQHISRHTEQEEECPPNENQENSPLQSDIDMSLDLPLLQWLVLQEEKHPTNIILLKPDPKSGKEFQPISEVNPVTCKWCEDRFASELDLRWHVSKCFLYNKGRHLYCRECDKSFKTPSFFRVHINQVHSTETLVFFKCVTCSKEFYRESVFKLHEKSHEQIQESPDDFSPKDSSENPLAQWILLQKETNPSNLILLEPDPTIVSDFQVLPISDTNTVRCLLCEKTLASESLLKSHVSKCFIFNKKNHIFCHICKQRLLQPLLLRRHLVAKHSGTSVHYNYKCNECSEKFSTKRRFSAHQAGHRKTRREALALSQKNKKLEKAKEVEERRTHAKHIRRLRRRNSNKSSNKPQPSHKCCECPQTFASKMRLQAHEAGHRRERREALKKEKDEKQKSSAPFLPCPFCPQVFSTEYQLRCHRILHRTKIRNYKCSQKQCLASFETNAGLTKHMAKHGNQPEIDLKKDYDDFDFGSEFSLDIPLLQWLLLQEETNPANKILLEPHPYPDFSDKFEPISEAHPVKCKWCEERFESELDLRWHVSKCFLFNKNMHRYCQECDRSFACPAALRVHVSVMHSIDPRPTFKCSVCSKEFLQEIAFKFHLTTHEPPKGFESDEDQEEIGNKSLEKKSSYFQCQFCVKSFISKCHLKKHERTHSGECPFKCEVANCGKAYKTKGSLLAHRRSKHVEELGLPALLCPECGMKFGDKTAMRIHVFNVHSESKPFKCTYDSCSRSFTNKSVLADHIRTNHTREKPFQCDQCGKGFPVKGSLEMHIRKTHQGFRRAKVKCPMCPREFKENYYLKKHMKVHEGEGAKSFKCKICGYLSAGLAYLRRHENMHGKDGGVENKQKKSDSDSDGDR